MFWFGGVRSGTQRFLGGSLPKDAQAIEHRSEADSDSNESEEASPSLNVAPQGQEASHPQMTGRSSQGMVAPVGMGGGSVARVSEVSGSYISNPSQDKGRLWPPIPPPPGFPPSSGLDRRPQVVSDSGLGPKYQALHDVFMNKVGRIFVNKIATHLIHKHII